MENLNTDGKKKNLRGAIAGSIGFAIAYFAVQYFLFKPQSFDDRLIKMASDMNKHCPIMIAKDTRLDNVMAGPENSFQYNYTLIELNAADVKVDEMKKLAEPVIVNKVKTSPDMKDFRKNKTTILYNYVDKNGIFITKIAVTPDKYAE